MFTSTRRATYCTGNGDGPIHGISLFDIDNAKLGSMSVKKTRGYKSALKILNERSNTTVEE